MAITGTAVAKFNNAVPITMQGEWNISVNMAAKHFYGQGDGSPASGYLGSTLPTAMNVSGSFRFVVDATGEETKRIIQTGMFALFAIDWPIGDPALGASRGKATNAHFDTLDFAENNPEGTYIITGTMSAGVVTGPAFGPPTT